VEGTRGERGGNEGNMKTQHGSEGRWVACNTPPPPPQLECKNRVLKENEKKKRREKVKKVKKLYTHSNSPKFTVEVKKSK
jgi:hypothetical protein